MSSPPPFEYRSSGFSEPGIFIELYLPKRAKYQEVLYKTLTEGFKFDEVVKRHFKTKKQGIQKVLQHHMQWRDYSDASIDEMEPFYWGYSLYEVDGVFSSRRNPGNISEERTQVIRIMFLPDLERLMLTLVPDKIAHKDILDIVKLCLRISGHQRGHRGANVVFPSLVERLLERDEPGIAENIANGNIASILDYTEKWFDDVGLFLFGYVIFEICAELKTLGDANEIPYEEEIWLTSFWNLNVNRISYLVSPEA